MVHLKGLQKLQMFTEPVLKFLSHYFLDKKFGNTAPKNVSPTTEV